MDNRERDRVSQRREPTEAGEVNRKTSEKMGREHRDSSVQFGENIRRGENLEGDSSPSRDDGRSGTEGRSDSDTRGNGGSSPGRH
jgi:hypothetical protein